MDLSTGPMAMTGSARRTPGSAHLLALLDRTRAGIVTVDSAQAVHAANRRLGELLRIPPAALADAVRLTDLLDGSAVLTEALAQEVGAALRGSIADSRPRTVAIVIGHGDEARFLALSVTPLADATWALTFEDTTERHAAEAMAVDSALRDPLTGLRARSTCARRWRCRSSSWPTSRRSISTPGPWSASRRCCAGATRPAGWCRRQSSSRWPRRSG